MAKTQEQKDIDALAEVVLAIRQRLDATGDLTTPLVATYKADDKTLVTATVQVGLAGRRC